MEKKGLPPGANQTESPPIKPLIRSRETPQIKNEFLALLPQSRPEPKPNRDLKNVFKVPLSSLPVNPVRS